MFSLRPTVTQHGAPSALGEGSGISGMKTGASSKGGSGFTLLELMIIVALLGLLVAIALPRMSHARDSARLNTIYNNLRELSQAKDQWALETRQPTGAAVDSLAMLTTYFHDGTIHDVVRETYVPNSVGTPSEADLPNNVGLGPYGPGAVIPGP